MALIDLHAHILPGLDDGPKTMEEAVALAKKAAADGTTHLVASPHAFDGMYWNDRQGVNKVREALAEELARRKIPLKVYSGMECRIHPDLAKRYKAGEVQTVNDSRYLLIELPYSQMPLFTEEVLFSLRQEGLVPVLVHPERNRDIQQDPNILFRFTESGMVSLLSADSVSPRASKKVARTVRTLTVHHLIHGVASDAHGTDRRPPALTKARQALAKITGGAGLPDWMEKLPERMLEDQDLKVPDPVYVKGLGFWQRLLQRD